MAKLTTFSQERFKSKTHSLIAFVHIQASSTNYLTFLNYLVSQVIYVRIYAPTLRLSKLHFLEKTS